MRHSLRLPIALALGTAIISGSSNFLAKIAVTVVKDPVVFTFLKNAVVAVLLLGLLILVTRLKELRTLTRRDWFRLLAIGVIGGGVPFVLFFTGLAASTALTASFIHKTLFLWVAILAVPFLHERIGWVQSAALLLLFLGNYALGFPHFAFTGAELMILGATILWAVENVIAKVALRNVSSLLVGASRMVIGSAVIFSVVAWQGKTRLLIGLNASQWGWTLLTSALLTGYVLTWYAALKRAPVTLVASLLVPATLVTNVLSAIFITHAPPSRPELISGGLLALAVFLIVRSAGGFLPKPATPHAAEIQT
ncbi:MAG: DMT family transporter [Candidatus Kerfeldbacteria bacterium]|nr:DMT family transporter [Candidatus Kerfeldbacteria bacterium]